ncbi:hypothetical protein AA958_15315 [Streptomyces sp. CNQ-509]|uniref:hypothetical protein n=1 Tax=unclassified Streptomyces TaxID=2593676 RepID=UPI00062DD6FC|nr:hypothetical protein [Streptomyces sp. CNQ-509]AKH83353.1 hypothetical protein AA958_15315 [Streptomyces sp. CNQ-509]
MAHNPQGQQPDPHDDPAGSTQMFRAFVDEGGGPQARGPQQPAAAAASSGPRVGMIIGIVVAVAVLAGVVWLAVG